jgi:tRNA (guanine-N7-)-methyltransferase
MCAVRVKPRNPYDEVPSVPDTERLDLQDLVEGTGNGPVELEIGFGKGHFLLGRAARLPKTRFLGLETRRKWVHLVETRRAKRALSNVRVFHGDARSVLRRLGPDASVQRIFIHFPDPWWKARHEKRMVICEDLLDNAARLLVDQGDIFVQTDVDFRNENYKLLLNSNPSYEAAYGDGAVEKNPFLAQALREMKCIETTLPVYRLLFCRIPRG